MAQQPGWQANYVAAKATAEKDDLPVLLHFHAWYCGPCQRMERDVFSDSEVRRALADDLTSVQVDVSHEPELAAQFGASTVPRDVVVFPDGQTETLNIGYMSRGSYLALLRTTAARGGDRRKFKAVAKVNVEEQPVPDPADSGAGERVPQNPQPAIPEVLPAESTLKSIEPAGSVIIGLEGYCPVRLHDAHQWTPGQDNITVEYRDIQYRFASETDRATFLGNPAEYAPQDLGCDPIVLTKEGKAVTGSIRYGAFFDERLYLFQTAENRAEFKQSPLKYIQIRSALKADQIQGTRFQ